MGNPTAKRTVTISQVAFDNLIKTAQEVVRRHTHCLRYPKDNGLLVEWLCQEIALLEERANKAEHQAVRHTREERYGQL